MTNSDGPRIHAGEGRALALSFVYFFCVLTAYYVIRPVREQLTAAAGSTQLAWFYAMTFVVILGLAPVFGALVSRYPRRVVVPVVYAFFIACLLAFIPLFTHQELIGPRVLGIVFYVWVSVFNLFVVSVFWIFMSDIWGQDQAKRLFPLIAVAGTAGAIAGPTLSIWLVDYIGVAPLLAVSAVLLGVAVSCAVLLGQWARQHGARRHDAGHEAAVGGGMLDGLRQIFAVPFVRSMAILLLLADGIGTVNYALLIDYAQRFDSDVVRTRFYGNVDLVTNILVVTLQVLVTRWLLPRRGAGVVIMIWALASVAGLALVIFSPDPHAPLVGIFPAVAIALIVSRGLAYGMVEPARHSLFARLPRNERYKGQNAVDTAVWRFGDMSIALAMNGLRSLGMSVPGFAALSAMAAVAAAALGLKLSQGDRSKGLAGAQPAAHS